MKKKILAIVLAVVLCAGVIGTFAACSKSSGDVTTVATTAVQTDYDYIKAKGELVVGITDFAPMNYKDASGNWVGFDTEFAEAVAKELGVSVRFVEIDWDNKILELNAKSIDCVWNGMTLTDEVTVAMQCSNAYINNAQVIVMKAKDVNKYTTVESLKGLKLVAEAGSAGEKAIKEKGLDSKYTPVSAQTNALMEVSSGSADACVIDITMAKAMTGTGTSYATLASGLSLTTEEYGIGFRKGSDMAAKVNAIIVTLTASGKMDEIANKYELSGALVSNQK